jgi:branched-chain amino acid transport system permease protein
MFDIAVLMQFLFSGITMGSVYALIALGLVMVYNASKVLCFAQGEFFVFGALSIIAFREMGLPTPIAFVLAIVVGALIGGIVEKVFIRPMRNASVGMVITMTVGISLSMKGIAMLVWGRESHTLPPFTQGDPLSILGGYMSLQVLWVIGITLVALVLIWFFFEKTMIGLSVRACAERVAGAQLVGISVKRATFFSWCWGSGLGALAGIVVSPLIFTQYASGTMPMLKGFTAIAIGGLGTVGAVVAGFALGLVEAYTIGFLSSKFADAIVFTILILVLLGRSSGLIGKSKLGSGL